MTLDEAPSDRTLATPVAFTMGAAILLIPANFLPILITVSGGRTRTDTIYSGVAALWSNGLWGIAAVVFTASLAIPILKILGLSALLWGSAGSAGASAPVLRRLHGILRAVGRWSMLDVFIVAFLSGLIRFRGLALAKPGPGIVAFAAVVVLTIVAVETVDPRRLGGAGVGTQRSLEHP